MGIWYTTREDVMSAQDIKATAYSGRDIDRAIESGARAVDALLHRTLYPWTGTRYFDLPGQASTGVRLYLDEHPLISATAVTSGGVTVAAADYFLRPDDGPPYTRIELDRAATGYWSVGSTNQRNVAVTGLWGWTNDETTAGTTVEGLDLTETGVDGSGMPTVGVGSVVRVDDERMVVTDKGWLTTAQTSSLTAQQNAQTVAVADGTAFVSGETLLIDAERVKVVDIAGNNLTVRRAVDGTTLAVHTTATLYALRTLTVQRGALGTTAATHSTSATVYEWTPPALAGELNLAYAINNLLQRQSGYARTSGSGDNQQEMSGRAIREIEQDTQRALGRMMRTAAV
jgi:hypothetical protein